MDTHDVGGRANYSDPDPLLCYLRIRRKLEPNMVVTTSQGVTSPFLLEEVLNNPGRQVHQQGRIGQVLVRWRCVSKTTF